MDTYSFFAHVAFGNDTRIDAIPQTTANMLIEINDAALTSGSAEKHLLLSALTEIQRMNLATGIARAAALDYVQSESEFSGFPVPRFVDFNLTDTPDYISIRPPPTKILPNDSKVWRLAESEADKLRSDPVDPVGIHGSPG